MYSGPSNFSQAIMGHLISEYNMISIGQWSMFPETDLQMNIW